MPQFYGPVDLVKNELRQAVVQNLGSAPSTPVKGQLWFDSSVNVLKWYDGTQWVNATGDVSASAGDTVTTLAIGGSPTAGTSALYSRADHAHGMPAFGTASTDQVFGTGASNGVATTVARSDHTHGNPTHDDAAHAAIHLSALAAPTAAVSFNGQRITSLGDPSGANDGATKQYVDNVAAGLSWKVSVRAATTVAGTLASSFENGDTIDGITLATNDRILIKNQAAPAENGIYTVNASGAPTRGTDADVGSELINAAVFVSVGTVNANSSWVQQTPGPITLGSTSIVFNQFAAQTSYVGGAGLTLTGATFDVVAGDTTLTVAADNVVVNTAVIATRAYADGLVASGARKFAATLTGTGSPETVTHNLGTRDVMVQVYNGASPFTAVGVDWDAATTNTVTVRYNPNLGSGYRVVVIG